MVTSELTPPQTIAQLLIELHQLSVKLWVENGRLYSQAPAGGIPSALRAEIQGRKAEIIAFLEAAQSATLPPNGQQPAIAPADRSQPLPLSFAQQRLWFLDQLEGGANPTYIIPAAYRLSGPLQVDRLAEALNAIVQRHEALRTNFPAVAGEPIQQIHPARPLALTTVELYDLPADAQATELEQRLRAEVARPFDLAADLLLRATVYVLSSTEHILLLTMHHIVSDGWSLQRLLGELDTLYSALTAEQPSPLPPLPIQYADYTLWQREWLQTGTPETRLAMQSAYWRRQLAAAPTLLELPTDQPRPAVQRFQGASERFELDAQLTAQLRALSRQHETTLFMTLLAAFAVQLARYSRQDDLVIGTPVANRKHFDLEALIGFFVNTLALRVQLQDANAQPLSFATLLQQIRQTTLDAIAHQDLPFERVIQELGIRRHLSHAPLVQVLFALENQPARQHMCGDLRVEPLPLNSQIAKFDLSLVVEEGATTLVGSLEYNTDLFAVETIRRMVGHLKTLLAGIVADPTQPIYQLPLLTAVERQQILVDWNDTAADYPRDKCVHHLFEEQILHTPDAPAVVFAGQQLTYAELNARANQLAHYLQSLGVRGSLGAEMLVGLCVERSIEMVVGLLGILKAGGAYLPLDPAYPPERLAFMLQDAAPAVIVTQEQHRPLFSSSMHLVCLDADNPQIGQQPTHNPAVAMRGTNLAYVIYTSGSTGQPKGALLQHDSLCNLAQAQIRAFRVQPGDRVLQVASLNFDASISEMVMALCAGATLVMAPADAFMPGLALSQTLQQQAITHVTLVPSALALLDPKTLPDLQTLIVAGEACPPALAARWAQGRTFLNAYGPTEITVCATIMDCAAWRDREQPPPIGRPITNVQVYLLDSHRDPVPVGVPGELYVGGMSVGRGYLNRPELTAERFIPNLFGAGRLYKTGDLARWLPDGNIEFLRRIDHQVKIRGFRIELGEIEVALTTHPSVQEAVVVAHIGVVGEKRLVAYVVEDKKTGRQADKTRGQDDLSISSPLPLFLSELRSYLQTKLPDYMVPAAFVVLAALPLTPNGKVDRKALPASDFQADAARYVAPSTPVEEVLTAIWAEVLGIPQVGTAENFFDLGGHSLLVTQILARIRSAFGIELSVRTLFDAATVAELARTVEAACSGQQVQVLPPPILSTDRTQAPPLSFAQQRLWFLEQLEGQIPTYHIPVALRLQGSLQVAPLQDAVNAIVQRHESLRTTFVTRTAASQGDTDAIAVQQIHRTMTVPLLVIDCQQLSWNDDQQRQELQRLLVQAADAPFDLTQGPLLRVHLYRLATTDHLLLVTLHHIIADGWSLDIFWQELAAFYQASVTGTAATLPPLSIQYADFAVWQRQWLAKPQVRETHLAYWRRQLADAPPLLELPTDHPRPPRQTFNGQTEWFEFSADVAAGLTALGKEANASLFMTLLASFALLLARYSRQHDLVIGTPIANRRQQAIEGLIGFFVNTLPLRINLANSLTFRDLLAHVRQVTLDGYVHQDLPFEQLVSELDIPRSLSYPPLFQVMVTHYKARATGAMLGNLDATPIVLDNVTAKFDLTLYLEEEAHSATNSAGLRGAIEYNSDLFDAPSIRRLVGHWQQLLQSILSAPATVIDRLALLTEVEMQQLRTWNSTAQPYDADQCIHHLFEAQVTRTPHAIAVVFDGEGPSGKWQVASDEAAQSATLTYAELNQRANQLAHHLMRCGVAPGHFVGLYLPPSDQLIIGMLGILKAGAAYVPLDAGLPVARLARMTQIGRILLVLTVAQLADRLPASLQRICLDDEAAQIAQADGSNPVDRVSAENLIYMIYTSGSTGTPKGAGVYHYSFVNLVQWFVNAFGLGQTDRVLITSSISFDLTQKNFFAPLIVGGQLHLSNAAPYEYTAMRHHIAQHEITWLNCAPSAFYPFVDPDGLPVGEDARFQALRSLRYLFLGGEPIAAARLQPWLQSPLCQATLVNTYGPTECTDVVATYPLDPADLTTLPEIPLGSPIHNVTLYVLDEQQQPVPVGVPGELWIGGVCVGAGYLDDPALTAAKFIAQPLTGPDAPDSPTYPLYRTGDLVRRRADGLLVFLGRIDHQVKVRGFRIELGEIEAALRRHHAVQGAVVVTVAEEGQATQLVAYVTPTTGAIDELATTLRQHLQAHLPDYMIPAAFLVLEQFPLTASGKIDRKRLPPVNLAQLIGGADDASFVAPATPSEERLAAIWTELLGLERIGRHHNFFALGGHSLLAVQLVARIRTRFRIELPVHTLFEAPTVAALAQAMAEASYHGETDAPLATIHKLVRQPDYTDLALSFAQERLWFLQRLENAGKAYSIPTAFHMTGALQVAALEQALAEMGRRHEVLRTTFPKVDGVPVQRIHATLPLPLEQVDFRMSDPAAQQAALAQRLRADANHVFDFDEGPLLRVTLYHLQLDAAVLLVNLHHIIADDWSVGVWWREFNALYQAFADGKTAVLPPLPIQYADFAQWQRARLTGEVLNEQLAYWQQQLAAAPTLLDLPTDRPRPATPSYRGALESFVLAPDLVTAIFRHCQELDVTPFMLLHTAFALLLARYSGQDDVVIGSPITNRQHTEIEPLIGFFVNTLALRTDLSGNPPFATVLARVRQTVLDAFGHADLPFERLVSELSIARNLNHAPLFQVLFVWQQALSTPPALGDLTVTPLAIDHTTAKFDLTLFLTEEASQAAGVKGITGAFEYNTDLFARATIQRMVGHLTTLLTAIVANPTEPIRELPLLSAREQAQLLYAWNTTQSPEPITQCLHQLFEAQVAHTPEAIAVVSADEQFLTYRTLNERANQLACYLQGLGVGPDVVVGICVERSIELMVGILGILKAGGAYLSVDASYPADRIVYMLTHAHAPILLTQAHLATQLPATATQLLCLEAIWPLLDQEFIAPAYLENPATLVTGENLLYVLYTSGSTGQPNAIAMPHRPLANLIKWHLQQPNLDRADKSEPVRTLQFSPISFDVSCQELFATWCAGGTLVLVNEAVRRDPYALLRYLVDQRIERLFLPFVALQQLAEAAVKQPDWTFALRDVITAGEQLQITVAIAAWFRRMNCTLHNHYGPTETHVITTYTLPAEIDQWPLLPPIGRPVTNARIYILDKDQQPVPIGVTGELYLGGAGVARGYLNRPELTQERFLPNPWGNGQLYRSGDLGRYRADGQIEYLGRADDQVKVRGYRIDPGEIEAVLTQHPTVQEAAVVAPVDHEGYRRLVAYVVPNVPADSRDLRALWRQHLQDKLPAYMLPTHLVALERFPLTPSGKVDRHQLLASQEFQPILDSQAVSPQTDLEKVIAAVWKELLQIDAIGLHDNFFDVGGHSLLVVQLHDRLQQTLAVELTVTDLFHYPTIAALAIYLGKAETPKRSHQENRTRATARRNALRQPRVNRDRVSE